MRRNNMIRWIAPVVVAVANVGCASDDKGKDLNGTWSTACSQTSNGTFAKTVLVYADLSLNGSYNEYSDATCETGYNVAKWTGTAEVGAELSPGLKKIDISFDSYKNTPLSAAAAMGQNRFMFCGFTDWAANVEKDVIGKTCFGFSVPVGGKSLDIYTISGTTLKFGQGSQVLTDPAESDRPGAIDQTRVFTRS